MFGKTSKFRTLQTLPVKDLVKGTPYKEGDLVFAKNKKTKVHWPAKIIKVKKKSCRIKFFATNEVEQLPVKKIFPYEENKQRVKAESLFYQAWQDIKMEAESKIGMNREAPKVKKTNWETTNFNKSASDSSSEVVQRKKGGKQQQKAQPSWNKQQNRHH